MGAERTTDVHLYDNEPTSTVPFDENCRRVREMLKEPWKMDEPSRRRIIRRLMLRWHPDKNKSQNEYAMRIFKYIRETTIKMERNEQGGGVTLNSCRSYIRTDYDL